MAKGLDILDVNRARKINLCGRQLKILHGFRRHPRGKKGVFALNVVLSLSPPAHTEQGHTPRAAPAHALPPKAGPPGPRTGGEARVPECISNRSGHANHLQILIQLSL